MCGIVGLHLKNRAWEPRLGELLAVMLEAMATRGPDSAGIAVYAGRDATSAPAGAVQYSLRGDGETDWELLAKGLADEVGGEVSVRVLAPEAAVLSSPAAERVLLDALRRVAPQVALAGYGRSMIVVKDVRPPAEICARYGITAWAGYQGIGHTRMATESAVTIAHSHPFAPASDLALVHNGSFSNYATVRRRLARDGISCETDNDSEVAARLVAQRMAAGDGLADALRQVLKEMDGFFTLLVSTRTEFAVVRDSFACKPAVVAETADYVAMASEYQALARLPGIGTAEVFEPMPEEIHLWSR
jgi:glutamate synthase domain-containing protein 1